MNLHNFVCESHYQIIIHTLQEKGIIYRGNSVPHDHEDHIAGRGENSLQHFSLVHKLIPMSEAMKIPAAKQWTRNGQNWIKFRRGT